jgi:uncharacterized membrane protein YfcA
LTLLRRVPAPYSPQEAQSGFVSGLTGIGGGVFLTPLVIVLGWTTPLEAARLAPPYILMNSTAGLFGALAAGQVPSPLTPWFVAMVVSGAAIGTAISLRWMTNTTTKYLMATIVLLAGLRLLTTAILTSR